MILEVQSDNNVYVTCCGIYDVVVRTHHITHRNSIAIYTRHTQHVIYISTQPSRTLWVINISTCNVAGWSLPMIWLNRACGWWVYIYIYIYVRWRSTYTSQPKHTCALILRVSLRIVCAHTFNMLILLTSWYCTWQCHCQRHGRSYCCRLSFNSVASTATTMRTQGCLSQLVIAGAATAMKTQCWLN